MSTAVKCRDCGQAIAKACLNPAKTLAKCLACDEVFYYAGLQAGGQGDGPERLPVPVPWGYDLRRDSEQMLLSWRWFEYRDLLLLVFCLFWNGTLLVSGGLVAWQALQGQTSWWQLAGFSLHALAGIWMGYYTLARFLNRTLLRVTRESLTLVHRPLWMPGGRQLLPMMIKQLSCHEKVVVRRRSREHGPDDETVSITYDVRAQLKDGNELVLINLGQPEEAEFIEQQIEHYLGIRDVPVEDEIAKRLWERA